MIGQNVCPKSPWEELSIGQDGMDKIIIGWCADYPYPNDAFYWVHGLVGPFLIFNHPGASPRAS